MPRRTRTAAAPGSWPRAGLRTDSLSSLTQVEVQREPPFLELQGDVVPSLPFPVEQNPVSRDALELQGDHIFERAQQLLMEPVEEGAPAVEVGDVGLCTEGTGRRTSVRVPPDERVPTARARV